MGSGKGSTLAPFIKRLSKAEMAERRAKGLCFNCDENFSLGHRCKRLFWLEMEGAEAENGDETKDAPNDPEISSLHAITGVKSFQTMQLQGWIGNQPVLLLVDSGSTHNFVRAGIVGQLGLNIKKQPGLQVAVANGERMPSVGICETVQIEVSKDKFIADLYVIPLEGFDIVLGVKWLCTLGPMIWDFEALTMSFNLDGRRVVWQGQTKVHDARLQSIQGQDQQVMLDKLLAEYGDIFKEPTGLPPPRSCDHKIHLQPGCGPVVVRPYIYPHLQKDEIER